MLRKWKKQVNEILEKYWKNYVKEPDNKYDEEELVYTYNIEAITERLEIL